MSVLNIEGHIPLSAVQATRLRVTRGIYIEVGGERMFVKLSPTRSGTLKLSVDREPKRHTTRKVTSANEAVFKLLR